MQPESNSPCAQLDLRRLILYTVSAFCSAFCGALALVPALTWEAVGKALLAGGGAAGLAAKAYLDVPLINSEGQPVSKMDIITAANPPANE